MSSYQVYVRSRGLFIAGFIFYFLVCFVISRFPLSTYSNLPDGRFGLLVLCTEFVVVFVSYYLAQISSKGMLEVVVMQDGLNLVWKKNFLFQSKPDRKIPFSSITAFERICGIPSGGYVLLRMADGPKMKLRQGLFLIGNVADFDHLINDLSRALERYRDGGVSITAQPGIRTFPARAGTEGIVYHAKNTSVLASVIMFFVAWISILWVTFGSIESGANLFVVFGGMAVIILALVYMYRNWIRQKLDVELVGDRIIVRYTYKPFFDRVRDREILLSDILSYKVNNYSGSYLTLYLKDGAKFKTAIGPKDNSDEFTRMSDAIIAVIEKKNTSTSLPTNIVRRKTIYEGSSGMIMAVVFTILILAMIVGIFFSPHEHETKDVIYGIGCIFTGLGFVLHIFSIRRKNKKPEG